jgi:PAS domain S-box-containing protein
MRWLFAPRKLGEDLRKSEARYRTVLDAAFDAIVTITPDGIIRWFNRGAERMFGYKVEEVIGQSVTLLMPERYRELCVAGLHRYLRTGEARVVGNTIEVVGLRKDGSEFPIEMSLGETLEEGERLFTGVIRDVTERKKLEQVINESEERFRSLVQNTSDIITLLDADGTVRYISPAVERVTGYKPEDQEGTDAFSSVHPDDTGRALRIFAEALKRPGLHPPMEFRVPHKDGTWRYLEHIVNNLLDDPAVRGVVVNSRDVTERKRAEELVRRVNDGLEQRVAERTEQLQSVLRKLEERERGLQESEHLYRTVVEHAAENIFLVDVGTKRIIQANAALQRSLGYSTEELRQLTLYDIVAHDQENIERNVHRILEQGHYYIGERRYRRKNGTLMDLEVNAGAISYQGREVLCVVAHDITERKKAETRFRALVEQIPAVTYIQKPIESDNPKAVTYMSPQYETMLGYPREAEILDEEHWLRTLHPEDRERVFAEEVRTDESGEPFKIEYRVIAADDRVVWVRDHAVLMRDKEGQPLYWLGVQFDVTEQKRTEEALREVREAERSRIARDLHDGVLQDLSYTTAAMGLISLKAEGTGLEEELQKAIDAIRHAAEGLRGAVNDLRLEEERNRPLPELVESLVQKNSGMARGQEIWLEVEDDFPVISFGDVGMEILRVIQEALTNARRHSGARKMKVTLSNGRDELVAEVTDDGRGFRPGTTPGGVGLRSMRERTIALGGKLEIESEVGEGTRVRLRVPLAQRGIVSGEALTMQTRIMLVDDHADFRHLMTSLLGQEPDLEVVAQAGSLVEARNQAALVSFDVAVLDLGLPDGNGADLIEEFHEANPSVAVLILSASLDSKNLKRATEAGADEIRDKLANPTEVVSAIRRLASK